MNKKIRNFEKKFSTTQLILLGFLIVILTGALILMLPVCTASGKSPDFVDALFTSTTSVCVTGLVTVPTYSYWSPVGKIVILFLIQFGGLGFMTCFTMLLVALGRRITLKERLVIQDSLNEKGISGMVRLVKRIIKGTLFVEFLGAFFMSFQLIPEFGLGKGIAYSIFTSVSAFCNAGIDLFGDNSLIPYLTNPIINIVICCLIISGGIGFTVWWDIIKTLREAVKTRMRPKRVIDRLTVHSRLALLLTFLLVVIGALFFFVMEFNNPKSMGALSLPEKIMASFFQSVTTRTAGFMTIPQENFTTSSQFLSILLMFVGGSPAGTAGGIKTVTFGIVLLSVISVSQGKINTEVFHRTIPEITVRKALAIMSVSLCVLICGTMLLSLTEPRIPFMPIFYEVTSALATVGLSQGLTSGLSIYGKLLIILLMYIGRIGPITMAIAFTAKQKKRKGSLKLPNATVIVG